MLIQKWGRALERRSGRAMTIILLTACCAVSALPAVGQEEEPVEGEGGKVLEWGLEGKFHYRDSDLFRFPLNFPFSPTMIPPGQDQVFLETVDEGNHFEISALTLTLEAVWSEALEARAKIDFIDLYDRNPTSEDRDVDVDELWIRFGREAEPAVLPERGGVYLKVGKMPKFERQDDRHLESYGLVSTAFNRFEDLGLELGIDLGRHLYLKGSVSRGNPLFIRDPNALAGDNGTSILDGSIDNPDPERGSGIVILYDAEVEDLDSDTGEEIGFGLGLRFADETGDRGVDVLAWGYQRDLAESAELRGTFYGGDLDILRGPLNLTPFPTMEGDEKEEFGLNLWLYLGGFSLFAQAVEQEVAGLERSGLEAEVAWSFDLPVRWAVAGQQVLPSIAPAIRYSKLDPDFPGNPIHPAPSVTWEWEKIDYGVRLGLVAGPQSQIDLTMEFADNNFVLANGREVSQDEFLATLRWQL